MFQKTIFGPKTEKLEEIVLDFPHDTISFPKFQENCEEDLNSPIISLEKNLNIEENKINFQNTKTLTTRPKTSKWTVLILIRRWIFNMKKLIFHRISQKSLNNFHYKIFQDDFPESCDKKAKKNVKLIAIFSKILNKIGKLPTLSPYNKFKLFWDFFIMIITLCHFFILVPLITFPDGFFHDFYHKWLFVLMNVLFCDVIMKLNSGFFEKGYSIKSRKLIFFRYLKRNLAYDLITFTLILLHLGEGEDLDSKPAFNYLQLIYFIKFPIFETLIQNFEEIMNFEEKFEACIDLLKLFVKLLFFAHSVACFWIFLGKTANIQGQTWLNSFSSFDEKSIGSYYLISVYWAITTISTTGYGDITPKNEYEYFFSTIIMILGSFYFGYSLNFVGYVFSKIKKEEEMKKNSLCSLNKLLKKNEIDFSTQLKIKNYMNFLWVNEAKQTSGSENEIFNKFTPNLKRAFLSQTLGKFLFKVPLFERNFSKAFLEELLFLMKPVHFEANSFIYKKGDNQNLGIYILSEGEVGLSFTAKNEEIILQKYQKGDYFGEHEFFTRKDRAFNLKSLTYSTAYLIQFDDFIEVLRRFEEDFEKYHMIKDKLLFSSDSSYFYQKCSSCSKNSHVLCECPLINPIITRTHLIQKITVGKPQNREGFLRRSNPKFNPRKKMLSIQKNQILFLMNMEKYESTLSKFPSGTIDSSEPSPLLKPEKQEKLSDISEKENEDSSESSLENISAKKIPKRKKSLPDISEHNFGKKFNSDNEFNSKNSLEEEEQEENEKKISSSIMKKNESKEISDFESMKLFKNYQPNYNYNVIIMLLNNEFFYRTEKSKRQKKRKTYKLSSKKKHPQKGRKLPNFLKSLTKKK